MANEPLIQVKNLKKAFGNHEVLTNINLDVNAGEVVSIIGRSGSGKSTLLRNINLLETPTGGDILFHGKSILSDEEKLSTYRAKVGMVFQSFNLFNNMTVLQNVMVPQQTVLKRDAATAKAHALDLLKQVGMDPFSLQNRTNYLAVKNNVSPSRGLRRWIQKCCSSTNQPVHLIRKWSMMS